MKYHRVTAHSFWWLKWCCSLYMLLMVIFLTACVVTKNISFTIVLAVMILILVMFFTVVRHTNFYKAGKISRLIQKHIEENQLYETAFRGRKKVYTFYPQTDWCMDTASNTLHIRFRLSGNQINLRGLETRLADRLEKVCLNIYEKRGYIEYLFELEQEKALVISSKADIPGDSGETTVYLSPSLIWNYRKSQVADCIQPQIFPFKNQHSSF